MTRRMPGGRTIVVMLALVGVVWLWQATGQAAPETQPVQTPEWVARAIAELGDIRGDVREAARQKLWAAGKLADSALNEALTIGDPEIASAAREILIDFRYGLAPDTPRQIADQIRLYRAGNVMQKRAVVQTMLRMGPITYPYLAKLSSAEQDSVLRSQIFGELARRGAQGAVAYLSEGDYSDAEQLLELAMSDGSDRNLRNYAAYMTLRGRGEQKIAELRQQMDLMNGGGATAQTLAYLYRAKGDLKSAVGCARLAKDPDLLDGLLMEAGDWKALAELHRDDAKLTDVERLGFLASYQRLAGDQEGLKTTIDAILRLQDDKSIQPFSIAEALLLNDRPDEGIEVLSKSGESAKVFDLLLTQQKFEAAIKIAEEAIAANGPLSGVWEAKLARLRFYLGQKQQALAVYDKLAASLENRPDAAAAAELIGTLTFSRLEDRAQTLAAATLERDDAKPEAVLQGLFADRDGGDLVTWYWLLKRMHGEEKPAQLLARLRAIQENRLAGPELDRLAGRAADIAVTLGDANRNVAVGNTNRDVALRTIAQTLLERDRFAAAQAILRRLAQLSTSAQDCVLAGNAVVRGLLEAERTGATSRPADAAMRQKRWLAAAELYAQASQRDRMLAAAMYLRGYALTRAGQRDEGRRLMQGGLLLPLGEETQRYRLAEALRQAGLSIQADQQELLVARTGAFLSWELGNALRHIAQQAATRGDYATAAGFLERSNLDCLLLNIKFNAVSIYLKTTHNVHRMRAMAMLKAGDVAQAMNEAEACLRILPGHIDVATDLWPLLVKGGHRQEAEKLFKSCIEAEQKLLEQYPDSATLHNSVAWLEVRCRQDLEGALAHALKGVELDPKNTAIIDTLAEAYFQLGQREKAIETMRKCIELEPDVPRHREALKRLEKLSPDTDPPPG